VRILFVSHVSALGGGERSLLDLLACLDRQRFSTYVALPERGELSAALDDLDIPYDLCPDLRRFHRIHSVRDGWREGTSLVRGSLAVLTLVRRLSPDIVHANSTSAALYAMLATSLTRRPLVWHLRDLTHLGALAAPLGRASRHIIVPSQCCARRVPRQAAGKISVIPNGICVDRFSTLECDPIPADRLDGPLVISIGQLVGWKRVDVLIQAAQQVRQQRPHVRFVHFGDDRFGDDPNASARLQASIDAAGLSETFRLAGQCHDIGAALARADVLAHAAYPEPFGRVVVEAMAAGKPVIAFAGDHGPAEIIRDGIDGVLATPRTADALAAALVALLDQPDRARSMGKEGQRRARSLYDRRLIAQRYADMYESPLGPRQRVQRETIMAP